MDSMGGMITYGLGAKACPNLMFGFFHLNCNLEAIDPPYSKGGGGPHVREGSQAANLIQQQLDRIHRQNHAAHDEDEDTELPEVKKQITITIGWKNKIIERKYIVAATKADRTVEVINLLNTYIEKMSVSISNMKRTVREIKIKFTKR